LAQFKKIALLGEIFGKGVQDLHYGMDKPAFRVFDICVDDTYCNSVEFSILATVLGVSTVPRVYTGPFDLTALEAVRDGETMLGGANIREGIVVRSATEARHEIHGRKICKMISPDYLTRKSKDATEFQ
jgi:RNA ligase (TIGR02306 family)